MPWDPARHAAEHRHSSSRISLPIALGFLLLSPKTTFAKEPLGYQRRYDHPRDKYALLKEYTFRGRIYFVDAVADNRLVFTVNHEHTYHTDRAPLTAEDIATMTDDQRYESENYRLTHNTYAETKPQEVQGTDVCELRNNAAVRVVGNQIDTVLDSAQGDDTPLWKDRRGFLHAVDFLKRQSHYNDELELSGSRIPRIPLTGILDRRTLRIESDILHERSFQTQRRLDSVNSQQRARAVLEGAAPNNPTAKTDDIHRILIGAGAVLARYDAALDRIRMLAPRAVTLPHYPKSADPESLIKFDKIIDKSDYRRFYDFDGFNLGKIDCAAQTNEYPETSGEPEDSVMEEVDPRAFGPGDEKALASMENEAQRLIDSAALTVARLQ